MSKENQIKFIKSQKNGRLAIHENYIYHQQSKNGLTTYWSCENRKKGCPAKITLFNDELKSRNNKQHDHLPNELKIQTTEFKNKLKRKAEDEPYETLRNSYENIVSQVN